MSAISASSFQTAHSSPNFWQCASSRLRPLRGWLDEVGAPSRLIKTITSTVLPTGSSADCTSNHPTGFHHCRLSKPIQHLPFPPRSLIPNDSIVTQPVTSLRVPASPPLPVSPSPASPRLSISASKTTPSALPQIPAPAARRPPSPESHPSLATGRQGPSLPPCVCAHRRCGESPSGLLPRRA